MFTNRALQLSRIFNCSLPKRHLCSSVSTPSGPAFKAWSLNENGNGLSIKARLGDTPLNTTLATQLPRISYQTPGRTIQLPRPCIRSLILDLPPLSSILPVETPSGSSRGDTEAPPAVQREEKQAARLVVIRRRMMKKHKLKKLRKKMKFEWAKVRQKREMRKEKAFQAVLIAQIREAEKFDAKEYVTEKLRQANEVPLNRHWKGRRLPEFLIRQYLAEQAQKRS